LNRYDWAKILSLVVIVGVGIMVGYYIQQPEPRLPIINPSQLNPALVDDEVERTGRNHRVGDFALLNQNGDTTTQADLRGKVYVADFFFTTCPTICIDMAKNMRKLQAEFANDADVMLVSHSVTPEIDSVPVLRAYADKQNAIPGKWLFLTGDKEQIYNLARKHYFAVMEPGATFNEHDFIHTDNFVLVDSQKRIRGIYVGTNDAEVDKLIKDIRILLQEERKQ
jgi:protein SCO1/2